MNSNLIGNCNTIHYESTKLGEFFMYGSNLILVSGYFGKTTLSLVHWIYICIAGEGRDTKRRQKAGRVITA